MKTIWIVGKALDLGTSAWQFHGAYEKQNLAENFCIDDSYFVGPCFLNEAIASVVLDWKGAYYPKLEPKKEVSPGVPVVIIELPGRTQPKRSKTE